MSQVLQRRRYQAKIRLPILGKSVPLHKALPKTRSERRQAVIGAHQRAIAAGAVFKPERMLGVAWMNQFVATGQPVNLCDFCTRKFVEGLKHEGYRPDYSSTGAKRGQCDRCSQHLVRLIPFYREDLFDKSRLRPDPKFIVKGVS